MRVLSTALCGMLAVSAAGLVLLREPLICFDLPDFNLIICEKPMAGFLSLEIPVQEKKKLTAPVLEKARAAEAVAVRKPVQTIEERKDAMLFEAEALASMPFEQAVVMPFE